jgi:anti-sigma B factor antagonist
MTSENTGFPDTESLDVSIKPGPIVAVSGEIDIQSGPQLRDQLLGIIQRHGTRLALDLSGVTFIDCAGISVLLATRRRAQLEGGSLRVLRASPRVRRIFALTRLDAVLIPKEEAEPPVGSERAFASAEHRLHLPAAATLSSRFGGAGVHEPPEHCQAARLTASREG